MKTRRVLIVAVALIVVVVGAQAAFNYHQTRNAEDVFKAAATACTYPDYPDWLACRAAAKYEEERRHYRAAAEYLFIGCEGGNPDKDNRQHFCAEYERVIGPYLDKRRCVISENAGPDATGLMISTTLADTEAPDGGTFHICSTMVFETVSRHYAGSKKVIKPGETAKFESELHIPWPSENQKPAQGDR